MRSNPRSVPRAACHFTPGRGRSWWSSWATLDFRRACALWLCWGEAENEMPLLVRFVAGNLGIKRMITSLFGRPQHVHEPSKTSRESSSYVFSFLDWSCSL
jgi:hypothetical protein